jgi:glycosyltransferase involved in cell wall biosynthesis
MVIAYVGAFQGSANPDLFLDAFVAARAESADFARDVRIRFVGPSDPESDAMVRAHGLDEVVERTGFIPHGAATDAMRDADVLLQVMGFDPGLKLALSSKLPEYLGAGTTVLSIVPEDVVAADVVRRSGGFVVPPTGPEPAKEALLHLHELWREHRLPPPDPIVVAEFDRTVIAEKVDTILRDAETPHA